MAYGIKITGFADDGSPRMIHAGAANATLLLSATFDLFWGTAFRAIADQVSRDHAGVRYELRAPNMLIIWCPKTLMENVLTGVQDMVARANGDAAERAAEAQRRQEQYQGKKSSDQEYLDDVAKRIKFE